MTPEQAMKRVDDMNQSLVNKRTLLLTVEVTDAEQADEICRWLYAPENSPMKAGLISVAWDSAVISKEAAELLAKLQELPRTTP